MSTDPWADADADTLRRQLADVTRSRAGIIDRNENLVIALDLALERAERAEAAIARVRAVLATVIPVKLTGLREGQYGLAARVRGALGGAE